MYYNPKGVSTLLRYNITDVSTVIRYNIADVSTVIRYNQSMDSILGGLVESLVVSLMIFFAIVVALAFVEQVHL
jgi:hypothetical protein